MTHTVTIYCETPEQANAITLAFNQKPVLDSINAYLKSVEISTIEVDIDLDEIKDAVRNQIQVSNENG
jgi:hypothetical protein